MKLLFALRRAVARSVAGTAAVAAALGLLTACGPAEPPLQWQPFILDAAGLEVSLPCDVQAGRNSVDFGLGDGPVTVHMVGCDANGATFAVSHYMLGDIKQADDALAFWQAAVLTRLKAVDGSKNKSGARFVPEGALPLSRSIRATVEGEGAAGWHMTTHGVWFARKEEEHARIYHAVMYAPKANHEVATQFFNSLVLR